MLPAESSAVTTGWLEKDAVADEAATPEGWVVKRRRVAGPGPEGVMELLEPGTKPLDVAVRV